MSKIIVFNSDEVELSLEIPKQRFIFILADDGRVWHIDMTDGNMWQAQDNFLNLGLGHRRVIAKETNKELFLREDGN